MPETGSVTVKVYSTSPSSNAASCSGMKLLNSGSSFSTSIAIGGAVLPTRRKVTSSSSSASSRTTPTARRPCKPGCSCRRPCRRRRQSGPIFNQHDRRHEPILLRRAPVGSQPELVARGVGLNVYIYALVAVATVIVRGLCRNFYANHSAPVRPVCLYEVHGCGALSCRLVARPLSVFRTCLSSCPQARCQALPIDTPGRGLALLICERAHRVFGVAHVDRHVERIAHARVAAVRRRYLEVAAGSRRKAYQNLHPATQERSAFPCCCLYGMTWNLCCM